MKRWFWFRLAFVLCPVSSTATTRLSNDASLPLVGLGVGNLPPMALTTQVPVAVGQYNYRLFDTAHASQNEDAIQKGISAAANATLASSSLRQSSRKDSADNQHPEAAPVVVHVITKVWYTYLGYERTILSVQESCQALMADDETNRLAIHMLLHWPRCRDDIPWMHCAAEEAALPQAVQNLGPAPHLHRDDAFLESWRALEDLYQGKDSSQVKLASIGVSNFDIHDLRQLQAVARIMPHIIQLNVWSVLFDPDLMAYCREHGIHVQVYNVMNGIIGGRDKSPHAWESLWKVTRDLDEKNAANLTPSLVVLAWLTQQDISVIPRTSSPERLASNAPGSIAAVPRLSVTQQSQVATAARALLSGNDLEPPTARFVNRHRDFLHLFWINVHDNRDEVPVQMDLAPGDYFDTHTFPGHVFVAYNQAKQQRREFTISASFGEQQEYVIDEL